MDMVNSCSFVFFKKREKIVPTIYMPEEGKDAPLSESRIKRGRGLGQDITGHTRMGKSRYGINKTTPQDHTVVAILDRSQGVPGFVIPHY